MKKVISILFIVLILSGFCCIQSAYADGGTPMDTMIAGMEDIGPAQDAEIEGVLAYVIKLIQYAGTGIALIVVTIYGIRYMLASPSEKADVKKQIIPILIGCALVFGTVTFTRIVASIAGVL